MDFLAFIVGGLAVYFVADALAGPLSSAASHSVAEARRATANARREAEINRMLLEHEQTESEAE